MKKNLLITAFAVSLCLLSGTLSICVAQDARLSLQEAQNWADGMAQALVDNFWGAQF